MSTSSMSHVPNGYGKGAAAAVDTGIGSVKEGQNVAGAHGLGEDPVLTGDPARIEHWKFIISNQVGSSCMYIFIRCSLCSAHGSRSTNILAKAALCAAHSSLTPPKSGGTMTRGNSDSNFRSVSLKLRCGWEPWDCDDNKTSRTPKRSKTSSLTIQSRSRFDKKARRIVSEYNQTIDVGLRVLALLGPQV